MTLESDISLGIDNDETVEEQVMETGANEEILEADANVEEDAEDQATEDVSD